MGERFWDSVTLGAVVSPTRRARGAGLGRLGLVRRRRHGAADLSAAWSLGQALRIDFAWPIEPAQRARRAVLTFGSSQAF